MSGSRECIIFVQKTRWGGYLVDALNLDDDAAPDSLMDAASSLAKAKRCAKEFADIYGVTHRRWEDRSKNSWWLHGQIIDETDDHPWASS